MTGPAVNTEKSSMNGSARIQAALPCRDGPPPRRPRFRRAAGGREASWLRAGAGVDMVLVAGADGVSLGLHALQCSCRVEAGLHDLLHLGVERSGDLLPGAGGRRSLRVLELLTEDCEFWVGGQRGVRPGTLH